MGLLAYTLAVMCYFTILLNTETIKAISIKQRMQTAMIESDENAPNPDSLLMLVNDYKTSLLGETKVANKSGPYVEMYDVEAVHVVLIIIIVIILLCTLCWAGIGCCCYKFVSNQIEKAKEKKAAEDAEKKDDETDREQSRKC